MLILLSDLIICGFCRVGRFIDPELRQPEMQISQAPSTVNRLLSPKLHHPQNEIQKQWARTLIPGGDVSCQNDSKKPGIGISGGASLNFFF